MGLSDSTLELKTRGPYRILEQVLHANGTLTIRRGQRVINRVQTYAVFVLLTLDKLSSLSYFYPLPFLASF